jgi:methyl-accepting chemotaxis protein
MFFDHNRDDAAQLAADLRGLITQQEYEYQRLIADLQLSAMTMENLVEGHKITDSAVQELRACVTNVKHDLRNARHELGEAADRMERLLNTFTELEEA